MTTVQVAVDGSVSESLRSAVRPRSGVATEAFLQLVDVWQSVAYRTLRETYGDDAYSKVLAIKAANLCKEQPLVPFAWPFAQT